MATSTGQRGVVATRVPADLEEQSRARALAEERTLSSLVRLALRRYLALEDERPAARPGAVTTSGGQARHDSA